MTVPVQYPIAIFLGNGTAAPLNYDKRFLDNADLVVTHIAASGTRTVLIEASDYTVSGAGEQNGGQITPLAPILVGDKWEISRATPLMQPTDYADSDGFPAESHELALDRQMLIIQEQAAETADIKSRALLMPKGSVGDVAPSDRADKLVGFGADSLFQYFSYSSLANILAPFLAPLLSFIKKGDPGPANNTYTDLAAFKAQPGANASATLATGDASIDGTYVYETARAPYTEKFGVYKLDAVDLSVGAMVRQNSYPVEDVDSDFMATRRAWGITRIVGGVPSFIDDSNHHPGNLASVSIDGPLDPDPGTIKPLFSTPGTQNGNHLAMVDESYAGAEVSLGIRGFKEGPAIFMYRPLDFVLNMQSLVVIPHPYLANGGAIGDITAAALPNGAVEISHPSIGQAATAGLIQNLNTGYETRVISANATTTVIQNYAKLQGRIRNPSGSAIIVDGPCANVPTATFNGATGELTLNLNQGAAGLPVGYQHTAVVASQQKGVSIGNVSMAADRDTLTIELIDDMATIRAQIAAPTDPGIAPVPLASVTGILVTFHFGWLVPSSVRAGVVRVRRGTVQMDAANASNPIANIWHESTIYDGVK